MRKTLFLVDVEYTGARPRVSINMSWRRFFAGMWDSFKDFWNSVGNGFKAIYAKRNVYIMNIYAFYAIAGCLCVLAFLYDVMRNYADIDIYVKGGFFLQFQEGWKNFMAQEFGILNSVEDICVLLLLFAVLHLICKPAGDWTIYALKVQMDRKLSKDIRRQLLKQKADAIVKSMNATLYGVSSWIVKIALATTLVWSIWTMLQG